MKKSRPSPKELLMKRLVKHIKIPHSECNRKADEKEYVKPVLRRLQKIKGRDIEAVVPGEENYIPYNLPKHMRMFITQQIKRKVGPDPTSDTEPHTIRDVDERFFSIIEGRPLRQFCDSKVYMRNLRDITLFRANAAYMNDQIIQINTSMKYELEEYKKISELFSKSKDNFVHFAKESYALAKEKQSLAFDKTLELETVIDKLEGYSFEYVKLRNKVSSLIAMYEPLSMYKKFLNSVSPPWWQELYEESCAVGSRVCARFAEDLTALSTTSVHTYKQSAMQLEQLKPTLYFKNPSELVFILDNDRAYCLNYLQIEASAHRTIQSIIKHRDSLKRLIRCECEAVLAYVDKYRDMVAYNEQYALDYEAVFDKLLVNQFERLFASYDSIKLFTCVQYVHFQLYKTAEDPKDKLSTLMCEIERIYIEVTRDLDSLDQKIVKEAANKMFSEDIKKMNRAHKAERILRECKILSKGLYTSFEPSRKQTNK